MVRVRGLTYGATMLLACGAALLPAGCILDISRSRLQLPPAEDASEDVSTEPTETDEAEGPGFSTWAVTVGNEDNSEPRCVRATSDGKFIATGYADSTVWAAHHVAVLKLRATGDDEWLWVIGGMQDDEGVFVDETAAGTYRVVGWTGSDGAGSLDALLLELQEEGAILSQRAFGTAVEETVTGAASTSDGGLMVCGRRLVNDGDPQMWVMKLSGTGDLEWARVTSHSSPVRAFAAVETTDGNYAVAGSVVHPGSDDDILIIMLDDAGNSLWVKRLVRFPDGEDKAKSIALDRDGNLVLAGHVCTVENERCDAWVGVIDTDGRLLDQTVLGGEVPDFGLDVLPDPGGGLVLFGSSGSYGSGMEDAWLLGLDGNLDVLWQKTYGGPEAECGDLNYNLTVRVDRVGAGGFILACGTRSYGVGAFDAWFLRVGADGGISGSCPAGMIGDQEAAVTGETDSLEDVSLSFRSLDMQENDTALTAYVVPNMLDFQCAD